MSRLRHLALGLALLATACGGAGGIEVISPDGADVDGLVLAYGLDPGQRMAYDLDMTMDVDMDIRSPDATGKAKMALDISALAKYAVGPGPSPGTYAVTMRANIEDIDFREFTMDGESLIGAFPEDELLAQMGGGDLIPELTVLLDERGNVLGVNGGDAFGADFLSGMGGGLGPSQGSLGREGLFGPPFPEEKLAIGSQWSIHETTALPPLGEVSVDSTYLVTGREDLGGRDVFVIKSDVKTGQMDVDLAEMFAALADASQDDLAAFGLGGDEIQQGLSEMFSELDGSLSLAPMRVSGTTWFDPATGLVVSSEETGIVNMTMTMSMPGMGSVSMDMRATVGYKLNLIDSRTTA